MADNRRWSRMRWVAIALLGISPVGMSMLAAQQVTARAIDTRVAVDARVANRYASRRVTVAMRDMPLSVVLEAITRQAGLSLVYSKDIVPETQRTSVIVTDVPVTEALQMALRSTNVMVTISATGRAVFTRAAGELRQSDGIIAGHVIDAATKRPLTGVTITLDEASRGVFTNEEGVYHFAGVSVGSHTVTARLIGRGRVRQTVIVSDGQATNVDFALSLETTTLDQVVVTGTVVPTELKAVPNAITVITAKQIEERGITKIDQLFRGDVPGLFAQNNGTGSLLDEVTMFSRGTTAIPGFANNYSNTNPIKTYVDGVELADPKYLSQIDPKSIERIEILTGPQASTIYGSNAINGVMQIFTKRGTTSTPQLTLNLLSGFVQNNFSSARTPQHDYSAQVNGTEGQLAYNSGGSWDYIGPWTPAKQTTRTNAFGGVRLAHTTPVGSLTADVTLRRSVTQNRQRGTQRQLETNYQETGWWSNISASGLSSPTTYILTGQTLGVTLGYTPTTWWSHEFGVGQDASNTETRITAQGYKSRSDTTLRLQQNDAERRSLRYTTTTHVPLTALAQATVTLGADAWQNLTSSWSISPQTLTGSLTGSTSITRQPGHNTGGFIQTQLGLRDRLFLTYGLRAEWNPDFGDNVQPNYAPRYGAAYTQDIGVMTVKLRGSYGRSTRPPAQGLKIARKATEIYGTYYLAAYGDYDYSLANANLGPEYQQGGEGGLEFYWGTRGSLVITRYNQTVDGLILSAIVDSVRSLVQDPMGWCQYGPEYCGYMYQPQSQNVNLGSIRNQGWELRGSMTTGDLTTHGTYSWTKSRVIGVNQKYQELFNGDPQYRPGATFQYLPEHVWGLGATYAHMRTTITLNVNGIAQLLSFRNALFWQSIYSSVRLPQNRLNMNSDNPAFINVNPGYMTADLTAYRQLSSRLDGELQVQNLMDHYANDYTGNYATMGRQAKVGLKLRLQ